MAKLIDLDGLTRYNTKLNERLGSTFAKKEDVPSALSQLSDDETHRLVTDAEKTAWNNKSEFSGSYDDLTDKPTIPSVSGLASETYVNNAVSDKATTAYVDTKVANLVNSAPETLDTLGELAIAIEENETVVEALNSAIGTKANQSDLNTTNSNVSGLTTRVSDIEKNKADKTELFSGSYNDLSNKPSIPTALSQLTQNASYRTVTDTEKSTWNSKSDFSGSYNDLTNKPTIPTNNNQLTNGAGYVTSYGSVASATKATQDGEGNVITETYAKKGEMSGPSQQNITTSGDVSLTIQPNVYYNLTGELTSLNITLAEPTASVNEYMLRFNVGTTIPTVDILNANGNALIWQSRVLDDIRKNSAYEISIVNDLGIATRYSNTYLLYSSTYLNGESYSGIGTFLFLDEGGSERMDSVIINSTLTVTATPNENYLLEYLTHNGETIPNGSSVKIKKTPSFEAHFTGVDTTLTYNSPDNGTVYVVNNRTGSSVSSGGVVRFGDILTISRTPNSGYALDSTNSKMTGLSSVTIGYRVTALNPNITTAFIESTTT